LGTSVVQVKLVPRRNLTSFNHGALKQFSETSTD
jgi:hypothetical protein